MAAQVLKEFELGDGRIALPTTVMRLKQGGFLIAGSIQSAIAGKGLSLWVQSLGDSLEPVWSVEVPSAFPSPADASAIGAVEHPEGGVLVAGAFRRPNALQEIKYLRIDRRGKIVHETAAPTCRETLSCNAGDAFLGTAPLRHGVLVFNAFTRGRELKAITGSAAQIVAHSWLYMLKWDGTVLWSKEVPDVSGRPVLVKREVVISAGSDPRTNITSVSEVDGQGNVLRKGQVDGIGRGTKVLWSQLADGYLLVNADNSTPAHSVALARIDSSFKLTVAEKFKTDFLPSCAVDIGANQPMLIGTRSKYGTPGPLAIVRIDTRSLKPAEELLDLQAHEIRGCSAGSKEGQVLVVYSPRLDESGKVTKRAILLNTGTQR